MEKNYDHKLSEKRIYDVWEKAGSFQPKLDQKDSKGSYTILLPPPNASGKMHTGNVLMIAIEDLLIRWKRMQGYAALWVPGTDHAGFETQITYERVLKKEGKSRFNFDRKTLYNNIWSFVHENKQLIDAQLKSMGASVDWSRYTFTLDDKVINTVLGTFKRMYDEGLIYKDNYMVNYCPKCGTTFADLEIKHEEKTSPLYYVKYKFIDSDDYVTVATTRPEPIFVDTHLAVHPEDEKNKHLVGKKVYNPLTNEPVEIIADTFVDPEFGTGVVKLTPGHDKIDYDVAKKHNLPVITVLDMQGRLNNVVEKYPNIKHLLGTKVEKAREEIVKILEEQGSIEKIDNNYRHVVSTCYKGGHAIEPMVLPNWFVKVESLKTPALQVVQNGDVKIFPNWREITYIRWMEEMHDWPISRQVVWGIQIPAWYSVSENPDLLITFLNAKGESVAGTVGDLLQAYTFNEIEEGLQTLIAPKDAKVKISEDKPTGDYLQETDTFDTWFSSGQWPLVTLGYSHEGSHSEDFNQFYPTSVLETGWEIIRLWVSRMIMFGIYLTGKPPFRDVYLHGIVRALDGKKMSKSLGNVINPEEYQDKYGTDALRMGLISGTANGKDFNFPKDKVIAYRNFANKLWNMARFILLMTETYTKDTGMIIRSFSQYKDKIDGYISNNMDNPEVKLLNEYRSLIDSVDANLSKYRFAEAAETIYHFVWHSLADIYIEDVKNRKDKELGLVVLLYIFANCLKILHPFMPFVTEEIWGNIKDIYDKSESTLLIDSSWPKN